jgi:hypothetical protein
MAHHDRLIAFLEREAAFLRTRIAHLEEKGWPLPASPGEDEGGPDAVETQIAGYKAKLDEIEAHIADLR